MLFHFQSFIEKLRQDNEKKDKIEKYEKYFGEISGDIEDQLWYKNYLNSFIYEEYLVPEELKDDFDWKILYQLIIGSLSSEYRLNFNKNSSLELEITVKSGDRSVTKIVSELWSFQILRLYEIYIDEQIALQTLIAEKDESIIVEQNHRIAQWRILRNRARLIENLNLDF